MSHFTLFRTALAIAILAPPLGAQSGLQIPQGDRVRVHYTPCERWAGGATCGPESVATGRVASLSGDTLVLEANGRHQALAVPDITQLQRHAGRRLAIFEGTLWGFLGGVAVGGAIGLFFAPAEGPPELVCPDWFSDSSCYERRDQRPKEFAETSLGVGATVGALAGALAATAFPVDRWEPVVTFRPSQGPVAPQAYLGLRVRL
jgi:hypothetical protein